MIKRVFSVIIASLLICLCILPKNAFADSLWPENISVEAEGGILIDADSGAVLYGKNIHVPYYPASITKILTALVIIENCNLDDTLTFSHSAVYDVEEGSTSAGYDEGDTLTVRDALYAMLLKSANEVANALAEHCAGSISAFADMMNEKAAYLGCTESHFANPSGLNDENHYVTAYDYALICRAAFSNPTFVEIDSTTYYDLPASKHNPEGQTVYCGHKMLKKSSGSSYYPGAIGGKTGYTMIAGNTLVTCAQRDGLKLISIILNGHQTHYSDTKNLLDWGFANFKNVRISEYDSTYTSVQEDIDLAGSNSSCLYVDDSKTMTLPISAEYTDPVSTISYDISPPVPENAIAVISYTYSDRFIGSTYLLTEATMSEAYEDIKEAPSRLSTISDEPSTPVDEGRFKFPDIPAILGMSNRMFAMLLAGIVVILVIIILIVRKMLAKHNAIISHDARRKRLIASGFGEDVLASNIEAASFEKSTTVHADEAHSTAAPKIKWRKKTGGRLLGSSGTDSTAGDSESSGQKPDKPSKPGKASKPAKPAKKASSPDSEKSSKKAKTVDSKTDSQKKSDIEDDDDIEMLDIDGNGSESENAKDASLNNDEDFIDISDETNK